MNAGVDTIMNMGRWAARIGQRMGGEAARAEMRGFSGTLNIEFMGPEPGGWHIRFDDGRVSMGRGLVDAPRATVKVKAQDYLAMLAGDLDPSVARMTGRVRATGDANLAMAFGASVGSLINMKGASGLRGRIGRAMVGRALRKGGYTGRSKITPAGGNA